MKNTLIKPPYQGRLICSNCTAKTGYETDPKCRTMLSCGWVFVAFCDFCETLFKTSGSSAVMLGQDAELPIQLPYVTGDTEAIAKLEERLRA